MTRKPEKDGYRYCKRCEKVKTVDNFGKNKVAHGGLHYYCRDCSSLFHAETYWKDPEYSRGKVNQWRRKHPIVKTPEFKERRREAGKKYRATEKFKRVNAASQSRRRARKIGNGGDFTVEEWDALCKKYGNKCLACGSFGDMTIDHIVPLSCGGSNSIDNIQPLCLACNVSKHTKTIDYRK